MIKDRLKILVVSHKQYPFVEHSAILPIQVNRLNSKFKMQIQGDDQGDNISKKNDNYCELTAMYWAWKNLNEIEYIGLFHYRRYLVLPSLKSALSWRRIKQYCQFAYRPILACVNSKYTISRCDISSYYDDLQDLKLDFEKLYKKIKLSKNIVYLPNKVVIPSLTVRDQYIYYHIAEDWNIMEAVLKDKQPDYIEAFETVTNSNSFFPYNMFIMDKQNFDNYCIWLFDLLSEVENKIHVSPYFLQKRVFGFMAERLFNVYIEHKHKTGELTKKHLELAWFDVK